MRTEYSKALYGRPVNWDDIPRTELRRGVRRQVYSTDEVMIARHELDLDIELNPHTHADFDQLVTIIEGRCRYFVDGVGHELGPGSFLLVPRGAEHYVQPTEAPCVNIDIFSPPRADFADGMDWATA